jgi:hypothetical protein
MLDAQRDTRCRVVVAGHRVMRLERTRDVQRVPFSILWQR